MTGNRRVRITRSLIHAGIPGHGWRQRRGEVLRTDWVSRGTSVSCEQIF